jgi:hypothetical protein
MTIGTLTWPVEARGTEGPQVTVGTTRGTTECHLHAGWTASPFNRGPISATLRAARVDVKACSWWLLRGRILGTESARKRP